MVSHADQIQAIIQQADGLLEKHASTAMAHGVEVDRLVEGLEQLQASLMSASAMVHSALGPTRGRQLQARINDAAHRCRTTIAMVQGSKVAVQAVWAQTKDAELALQKVIQQLNMLGQ